jgi:glycerol-1-phosphate dehydrogenase [NAD(P)+]
MDGFASSGAAMIERGMKVTHTVCAPELILGDTDILCAAPADMIRSGYADIIGKYSALCDWKLAHLVHGEPLCPMIYDTVKDATDEVRSLASALVRRDKDAVGRLFEILVLVGACLTLQGSTRPGSGSEHHLSHYFEITGLLTNRPHLVHGIDVGYASVITARLRQKLAAVEHPRFTRIPDEQRLAAYREIYGPVAPEVWELQKTAGRYASPLPAAYTEKWEEIRAVLSECPTAAEMQTMLTDAGFDGLEFTRCYTKERVEQGVCWGKDLKDRYSVLWLWSETEK